MLLRRVLIAAGSLAAVLLMAGCARYEFSLTVNDDGTGEMEIVFTVPEGVEQPLLPPDAPEGAEAFVSDDGWHGWRMSLPFHKPDDVDIIRSALNPDQKALHDFTVTQRPTGGWNYDHTIPAFTRLDTSALDLGTGDDAGGHYLIRVRLPGSIASHNATRIEDGVLVWELDHTSDSPVTLTAVTENTGGIIVAQDDDDGADAASGDAQDDTPAPAADGGIGVVTLALGGIFFLLLIVGVVVGFLRFRGGR